MAMEASHSRIQKETPQRPICGTNMREHELVTLVIWQQGLRMGKLSFGQGCGEPVSAALNFKDSVAVFHAYEENAFRLCGRFAALAYAFGIPRWDINQRSCVGRDSDIQVHLLTFLPPFNSDKPSHRPITCPHEIQSVQMRFDADAFETGLKFVNACNEPEEPLAHATESVMVEGVHAWFMNAAVRLNAIPPLPNRRGTHPNHIEP